MIMGEEHVLPTSLLSSFDDMDDDFDEFLELAAASDEVNNNDDNLVDAASTMDERYTIPTYNAVHMEIQENAKLPTFNMNVDRSNSSDLRRRGMQPCSPTTRREIEEMMRLSDNDFSLTEVFLKSNGRSSQNMNYSAAGSLLTQTGNAEQANEAVADNSRSENLDGKTEQTTSLMTNSGTKTLNGVNGVNGMTGISHVVSTNGLSNGVSNGLSNGMHPVSNVSNHSMTNTTGFSSPAVGTNQSYYTRPHQLPIPNATTGTPTPAPLVSVSSMKNGASASMAAALATAAALVPKETLPDTKQLAEAVPHAATPSPTPIIQSTTVGPIAARPTFSYPPPPPRSSAAYPYSRLNAAGPTPQMADATKRRSQFGFGGNHQVPCVPLPPQRASGATNSTSGKKKKQSSPPVLVRPTPPPPVEIPVPVVNAGPAYERKKQRAKDARVKLNESIEKLAVSISLAGSQSAQRASSTTSTTSTLSLSAHTKQAMETCAATAEAAKKWDRPAFVGSAATLIQELNAQCEALVRELEELQSKISSHGNDDGNIDDSEMSGSKRMVGDDEEEGEFYNQDNKRRRMATTTESEAAVCCAVWNDITIMGVIASFMDPHSLLRGQCACKNMHHVFSSDALWLDRCIQRFGLYMVRQWKEKLSVDDEDDGEVPSASSSSSSLSPIKLYEQMDALNAQPISGSPSAQTRMPHLVSAWVTAVERSNGETSRSVLQLDGRYTSTPVVELRILVQNTGSSTPVFLIPNQEIVIDASTRRRGEEWKEVTSDARFRKRVVKNVQLLQQHQQQPNDDDDDDPNDYMVSKAPSKDTATPLHLYESRVIIVHVHCKGCSTASKFQQRANFLKVLVQVNGTTIPLVIPFFRESLVVSSHPTKC